MDGTPGTAASVGLKEVRCRHCGCSNSEHEHRCRHCGRWLEGSLSGYPVQDSAAVPATQPEPAVPQERTALGNAPRQPSLFPGDWPKIIPFESLSSGRMTREQLARVRRQSQRGMRPGVTVPTSQQSLDLRPSAPRRRTVYDEAPIAGPRVRLKAGLVDGAVFAAALGLAAAAFHFMGGAFALTHRAGAFFGAAAAALFVFYHLFWCVLGRETAGMRCFRLRLLTFDGSAPDLRLRLLRFAATGLGIGAAGLGLIWALVDEEGLTWHDHISKTFPTVQEPNPGTFHRK